MRTRTKTATKVGLVQKEDKAADVLCSDHSRVVLKGGGCDYIHANFVSGEPLTNTFICAQVRGGERRRRRHRDRWTRRASSSGGCSCRSASARSSCSARRSRTDIASARSIGRAMWATRSCSEVGEGEGEGRKEQTSPSRTRAWTRATRRTTSRRSSAARRPRRW